MALENGGTAFPQEDGDLMQLSNQKEQNPQLYHCKSFKTRIVLSCKENALSRILRLCS